MPIQRMMYLLSLVIIVTLVLLLFTVPAVLRSEAEVKLLHVDHYKSYLLADELRQNSDDLTRMVRAYAGTGDKTYKTSYFDLLAIQDGEKPRPVDYHLPYWDYVAAGEKTPRPASSETISLVNLMKRVDFTERELQLFEKSKNLSDELIASEERAMFAIEGLFIDSSGEYTVKGKPDFKLAGKILYSKEYEKHRAIIVRPLNELTVTMNARFTRLIDQAENHERTLDTALAACFVALLLSITATIFIIFRKVITPVKGILDVVVKVAQGDLTHTCKDESRNELGMLGSEINAMTSSLSEMTGNMQGASTQLSEAAESMAIATKEQEAATAEQAASTQEIFASSQEISKTGNELLNRMGEVGSAADLAVTMAQQGHQDLAHMEDILTGMVEASKDISDKLADMNEKTSNICMVVTTINKVADQTNLLSVNAALEADKAGAGGIGFATVASEIRRLADQTAVATWDIEQLVKEIQSAVSSSVIGMEKFHGNIGKGVAEIQQVSGKFSNIVEQVKIIGPHFEAVHEGMESQNLGASEISEGISQLSETVADLLNSIRFSNSAIAEVNSEAKSLQKTCSGFSINQKA